MLDLRAPALPRDRGERLNRADYRRDFQRLEAQMHDQEAWKLERRQHFEEQGSASRDALRRGDWAGSLHLLESRRPALLKAARQDEQRGYTFHRVRIVERPLTPYVQWELHSLRIRAEYGERIRIIDADKISAHERSGLLPELVTLGGRALFHILYTDTGVPNGAIRYTDPDLINGWDDYLKALYAQGADIAAFFTREVEALPPPTTRE